jgi:putrescine aminotransferase
MDAEALFTDVLDKYARHLNPHLAKLMAFAGFGVETRAEGCYLYDHEGRRYLDCLGGYGTFSLGHRHPKVVEAVRRQLDHLALSGKAFFSQPAAELAAALAEIAPGDLHYSFFCNSGAEAVEAALKFAKGFTRRSKIVSTHGGYHGKTLGALSVTGREKYRLRFEPLMPGGVFVPYDDVDAMRDAVDGDTAAVIVEAIQGEGGIRVPSSDYLPAIRELCDRHGALLIVDEVQTGLGRTGRPFGCDLSGVVPDLMPLAKALGSGVMPLGAVMGTERVFDAIFSENPLAHTSTFGGNPLACAAGLAGLRVLREEGLVERSAEVGAVMKGALQEVAARRPSLIAEVRGEGLMLGVEMREDEVGELIVAQLLKRGVCVAYTLNNPRVLRFEPPLIITLDEVHVAVSAFDEAVAETEALLEELV